MGGYKNARLQKHAKAATGHYHNRSSSHYLQHDRQGSEAYQKAMAAAPDVRSMQEVHRMRGVIAAASKKKLVV